ncbi:metal-dependent transcriptional regulator [Arthrobacter sp. JSM 101049]|uniref:metal-dependent transcriptional regulator n=1 Tax=Arthrobacter sp. JSM 101049 TaxID=929097 RepID=UPI003562F6A3
MTPRNSSTPPPAEGISRVAEDFLKAIWSATEWGGAPITGKALAERFGTTAANVSDTIRRLTAQGLVSHEPYKPVRLTPAGERHAVAMVRKHRLIESFLVRTLGYSWEEVHDEAENLEHAASETMIDRIDALLGHPDRDPHGDPIPAADGTTPHPKHAVKLTDASPGSYEVTRISDDDPAVLRLLAGHGLRPGSMITVGTRDAGSSSIPLEYDGGGLAPLPDDAAAALWLVTRTRR